MLDNNDFHRTTMIFTMNFPEDHRRLVKAQAKNSIITQQLQTWGMMRRM